LSEHPGPPAFGAPHDATDHDCNPGTALGRRRTPPQHLMINPVGWLADRLWEAAMTKIMGDKGIQVIP
jgi:hypothetical protein